MPMIKALVSACSPWSAQLPTPHGVGTKVRLLLGILITASLAWLGAAGPTGAAVGMVVATPKSVPAAGPVLAGDQGLLWIARRGTRVLELWAWSPGGGAKRLQRFVTLNGYALNQPGRFASAYLSASSTHVGLELVTVYAVKGQNRITLTQTFLGELGRPLGQVSACRTERSQRSVDVQGATAVFRGPTCDQATVRDLGRGVTDRRFGGDIFAMRLADPFEAWLEFNERSGAGATAVVRDRRTSAEVTRAPFDEAPTDVSLRADGTVALLQRRMLARLREDRFEGQVAVVAAGATTPRVLPLTVLSPFLSRWTGSNLGVVAGDRPDSTAGVLRLVDAEGRTTRRIAELGEDRTLMTLTDLNATRAAWVTRGCTSAQIRTITRSVPETARLRPDRCRLRLTQSPTMRGSRLRLGVSCAGFASDCAARLTIRVGQLVVARGSALPRDQAPHYAQASLRVTRTGRALLANRRRVRIRITARIGRFATLGARERLGEVTRRTTRTIRR